MVGIYFLQVLSLAVLLVKGFAYALLVLPLLVLTIIIHVTNAALFRRPWSVMSLKQAALLDARDKARASLQGVAAAVSCGWRGQGGSQGECRAVAMDGCGVIATIMTMIMTIMCRACLLYCCCATDPHSPMHTNNTPTHGRTLPVPSTPHLLE